MKIFGFLLAGLLLACIASPGAIACPPSALGTSRILPVGTQGGAAIGLKTYPQTLALADHEVVLTFDDGPSPKTTPAVLDALAKDCVKATFFLIGRNAQANPGLVKREITEGHTVGHHTMTHPPLTLRGLADTAARADIDSGFAADDSAAYGASGPQPRVKFFRFPGFGDTKALLAWLASRDIAVFGTDLWASDWIEMSPEAELALLMRRLQAEGRGIVLLHDIKPATAAMLPAFLSELKAKGFKIVHLVPGDGAPKLTAAPAGWTSETEKILARMWPKLPPPKP